MRRWFIPLVIGAALLAGTAAAANPPFVNSTFVSRIDNPWFPLKPGTVYVYRGSKDGQPSRDVVHVTRKTRTIEGVRATAVDDRLYLSGHLGERTTDWYAQDRAGNVWYLGEATAELDRRGHVTSREGSWLAGRDGARAGIYMPAKPVVGRAGVQEVYPGHAEDQYRILSLHATVTTPFVRSHDALLTREWTRLEPGVVDHKLYVRGIGTAREETVKGGRELAILVSVTHT